MSDNISNKEVWVVGAGPMALDHAKVLKHLGITPTVIGRGDASAKKFEDETGISVHRGGLQKLLHQKKPNQETFIIITVGTEVLMPLLIEFIELDFARILIEKPAAISMEELIENEERLRPIQHKVFVAYNRRFYPSVKKAKEFIEEDGGLQSIHFEFTEWSHKIEPLDKAPGVKENWFFANSTHVVDLAFFIAGKPTNWHAFSKRGTLSWHKESFFTGAGTTENGVLFSYHSNWESAGSWEVVLKTKRRRLSLNPLESLKSTNRGEVNSQEQKILSIKGLKMGLTEMLEEFLGSNASFICSLNEHFKNTKSIYFKIIDEHVQE
ncbi:hypothetical protein N9C15_00880 [Schleiferiaceae bacterium]|nr:hypothetical protein [Schleiferiaceae bacterium]